jgi:hypothetical protein
VGPKSSRGGVAAALLGKRTLNTPIRDDGESGERHDWLVDDAPTQERILADEEKKDTFRLELAYDMSQDRRAARKPDARSACHPRLSVRHHPRAASLGRFSFVLIEVAQHAQNVRTELLINVLDRIDPHGAAENPVHVGFDRDADDIDELFGLDKRDDIAKIVRPRVAQFALLLIDIRSADVAVGDHEQQAMSGAACS